MNRQRDGVGLTAFDDRDGRGPAGEHAARPPARSCWSRSIGSRSASRTNVSKPLHQLAESMTRRGMVVLISDLLDDPEAVVRGLKHFQYRGTDVLVFHMLDPDELEFPFERTTRFEDLETSEEVMAVPGVVREPLSAADGAVSSNATGASWARAGIDYQLLSTTQPLEMALLAYLSTRVEDRCDVVSVAAVSRRRRRRGRSDRPAPAQARARSARAFCRR